MEKIKNEIKKVWKKPTLRNLKKVLKKLKEIDYVYEVLYISEKPENSILFVGNGFGKAFELPGFYKENGKTISLLETDLILIKEDNKEYARNIARWCFLSETFRVGLGEKILLEEIKKVRRNNQGEEETIYTEGVYLWRFDNKLYKVNVIDYKSGRDILFEEINLTFKKN